MFQDFTDNTCKSIIQEVALKLNKPIEEVKTNLSLYFEELHNIIEEGEHSVKLDYLGKFVKVNRPIKDENI